MGEDPFKPQRSTRKDSYLSMLGDVPEILEDSGVSPIICKNQETPMPNRLLCDDTTSLASHVRDHEHSKSDDFDEDFLPEISIPMRATNRIQSPKVEVYEINDCDYS